MHVLYAEDRGFQARSHYNTGFWRYDWRDVRVDANTLKIDPLLIPLQAQPARIAFVRVSSVPEPVTLAPSTTPATLLTRRMRPP